MKFQSARFDILDPARQFRRLFGATFAQCGEFPTTALFNRRRHAASCPGRSNAVPCYRFHIPEPFNTKIHLCNPFAAFLQCPATGFIVRRRRKQLARAGLAACTRALRRYIHNSIPICEEEKIVLRQADKPTFCKKIKIGPGRHEDFMKRGIRRSARLPVAGSSDTRNGPPNVDGPTAP